MDASDKPAIQTCDLSLWYGRFQGLSRVCVNIREGIITSLIGPSGCGKTTLLRCFNRVNERQGDVTTSGEVRILGRNIYAPDVSLIELRKAVGMVFQRPNVLPISVYENIVFGLRIHGERRTLSGSALDQAVEKAMREADLWSDLKNSLHRPAISLSLEQQQKLCIARLLPLKPEVILMDEPCSALDASATETIEQLLVELKGRYTIVIVTHNMAQARRISDECIYMLSGEVVEHGPTADVFERPTDPRTSDYVKGRYG